MPGVVADVVMFSNIPKVLSYAVPEGLSPAVGCRVVAPVRKKLSIGVVIAVGKGLDNPPELKDIHAVLDDGPFLTTELLELLHWTSRYYHAGIGPCMALAFPPYFRQGRTLVQEEDPLLIRTASEHGRLSALQRSLLEGVPEAGIRMSVLRGMFPGSSSRIRALRTRGLLGIGVEEPSLIPSCSPPVEYSADQCTALKEISRAIARGGFHSFVLHGITGSGKTEVYLAAAMETIGRGRSVLYLVPEIALTSQTIDMVKSRIPLDVAVFHSGLPERDRAREFMKVVQGGARFVLGTRSAVFSPLKDIGLIVVDEEHDHSYKQDEGVPYNARDLSIVRATNNHACVILGSATPSMETYERARKRRSGLITMTSRIGPAALPEVEIVDMRNIPGPLSEQLTREMARTLDRNEQVLLFINRRGFSAALVCPGCGKVLRCRRCDRSLTYHRSRGEALCHWCGFSMRLPEICPSCGCLDMRPIGLGTEKVLHAVEQAFPGRRLLRMDSDEMTTARKLNAALDAIRSGRVDIIVGTQMIAKGHDFPHLTLVGVVHAEQLLYMPDFRSGERTFQQIVQVAGRAGRRKSDTRVVIQTLIPDHPLIGAIARHDYGAMMEQELSIRSATGFPPYMHLARCVVTSDTEKTARDVCRRLASSVRIPLVEVIGAAPAPISLLRDRYRWHLVLRSQHRGALHKALDRIEQVKVTGDADLRIDVDPYSMM
ncbi:MAG: primosomal protein N' [Desulfobacterota bacterium]|nr:primosomal protein N' [Thermodesulfobacteriota bacterium]